MSVSAAFPTAPRPFLQVRVNVVPPSSVPGVLGMCAGYDEGVWREADLAVHLCKWIPEWALTFSELPVDTGTVMEMARRAALKVYTTDKYERRGEFGELMLHAVVRQEFGSEPAISKIFFKDAANDTVKGFDCVHVVEVGGNLSLWLGEAKFYERVDQAVKAAAQDLREHLERDYLRSEFAAVSDKLDPLWPLSSRVAQLIEPDRPLGEIVDDVCIPVLISYESLAVRQASVVDASYTAAIELEALKVRDLLNAELSANPPPRTATIQLIVLPISNKKSLIRELDRELRAWQGRT